MLDLVRIAGNCRRFVKSANCLNIRNFGRHLNVPIGSQTFLNMFTAKPEQPDHNPIMEG